MKLRQALVLAINTSILAVLFAFSAWLYTSTRRHVQADAGKAFERGAAMTEKLASLRERELTGLAQSLAGGPMIRAAVSTEDRATIEDALRSSAKSGGVELVLLSSGGKVRFSSKSAGGTVDAATRGRFRGKASLDAGGKSYDLWAAEKPSRQNLDAWTGITGLRYAFTEPKESGDPNNLPEEDAGLAAPGKSANGKEPGVVTGTQKYYAIEVKLLGGRFETVLYDRYAPYWEEFEERRNSLVVLGTGLFFLGLLLSVLFAWLIDKYAPAGESGPTDRAEWKRLLSEIESARRAAG
jgi:hypothetical protein